MIGLNVPREYEPAKTGEHASAREDERVLRESSEELDTSLKIA